MSPKQALFVREYLIDRNAAQAAIRAGYSKKTARQIGARLLTNVDIAAEVAKGEADAMERAEVTKDMVVAGLLDVAKKGRQESAKVAAWSWLGRSLAMFTDKQEIHGDTSLLVEIVPAPEKAK